MYIIPDIPERVETQNSRAKYLVSKVIDLVADDDSKDAVDVDEKLLIEDHPGRSIRLSSSPLHL
jgi:hypothetical protein